MAGGGSRPAVLGDFWAGGCDLRLAGEGSAPGFTTGGAQQPNGSTSPKIKAGGPNLADQDFMNGEGYEGRWVFYLRLFGSLFYVYSRR